MMLIGLLLAAAVATPMKFDLVCKGHNTWIGFADQKPTTYEERFSIDLAAGLFSDSDHLGPTKIAKIDDQTVWLVQTFAPKVNQYLALGRLDGNVSGETDYLDGHKVELSATCKVEPFSTWDHRKF